MKFHYDDNNICFHFSAYWPVEGIVGGHNTTINRHPWQVSVQHDGNHFCGAAIINRQWVLTSAQCASKYVDLSIRAGSNHIDKEGEVYKVDKIIIHPSYNEKNFDSDLALLRLAENLTVDHAMECPLPQGKFPILDPNVNADITGWGYTSDSEVMSDIIEFAQLPLKKLEDCRENYAGKTFTENMLCAGYTNVDMTACTGDYGGPVMVTARLGGILSWGEGCGNPQHPSVFVVVSPFVPWINETAIYS